MMGAGRLYPVQVSGEQEVSGQTRCKLISAAFAARKKKLKKAEEIRNSCGRHFAESE